MKKLLKEELHRMHQLAGLINESVEESLLKEEKIDDFFHFLERNPKKGSFAYAYYTRPLAVNKSVTDVDGEKKPNPYYGKLFKHSRYRFSFEQLYADKKKKEDPDYVAGERRGEYQKVEGFSYLETGKSGLYLPIMPTETKSTYSVVEPNGENRVLSYDDIKLYLRPQSPSSDGSGIKILQLIVDKIAKLSTGGNTWVNPNFMYEYLGPGTIGENKLTESPNQMVNETPYDDIDFGFLDQEDQEKNTLRIQASEELYNRMAKDSIILKEIYHFFTSSQNEEDAKKKFKNSQYYSRVENYMEDLYKNSEYRKKFGDGELLKLCEKTFDKFFRAAYDAANKRHERTQNNN